MRIALPYLSFGFAALFVVSVSAAAEASRTTPFVDQRAGGRGG